MEKIANFAELPDFKLNESLIPPIKIRSLRIENLKVFKDYSFDFTNSNSNQSKSFACFYGPNGTGKTTILDIIQLIFSRFSEYEEGRLKNLLGRSVRHEDGNMGGIYGDDDFLITAVIDSSLTSSYEIKINKSGFVKDHPEKIKEIVYRLCFYARLDQELHQFQLSRKKWPIFKELCEAVTGFEIEEKTGIFDLSEDPVQAELLNEYVLGFWVKKPHEKISHTECSAGERKIIKSFSTMLNKDYIPKIICIDNIAMHVELGRHIALVDALKKCFSDSQIFATTHSYRISRNFGQKDQLYDLRLVNNPNIAQIRFELIDELEDSISKLRSLVSCQDVEKEITTGQRLIKNCYDLNSSDDSLLLADSKAFFDNVVGLYMLDISSKWNVK